MKCHVLLSLSVGCILIPITSCRHVSRQPKEPVSYEINESDSGIDSFPDVTDNDPSSLQSYTSGNSEHSTVYDEGFEEGFDQGEEDGRLGRHEGAGFDDSNDYSGRLSDIYCQGYEDGYEEGYDSGRAAHEEENDEDEDED